MLQFSSPFFNQIPLIEVVNEDDQILFNSADAQWYRILDNFQWQDYLPHAVDYYNALYHLNKTRNESKEPPKKHPETKSETKQMLLFSRATMDNTQPVLHQPDYQQATFETVSPYSIAPGITPDRIGGKRPKCFFSLFKSFLGVSIMEFKPEPKTVHTFLTDNPAFARVCGFIPKGKNEPYSHKSIPSLRTIEQFDQIMTEYGLWDQIKLDEVRRNIEQGVIKKENELVGDTTHYYARSGFETITFENEKGKEQKKSQSKVTKNCRCQDRDNCDHPWQLADDGAGTIVKAHNKFIWGHKASILGLPLQGIPLDAAAVSDAATFDGKTFLPHVEILFEHHPEVNPWIDRVLYDSACDDKALKEQFRNKLGIELKASFNPRGKKTIKDNLPKGVDKITPSGNVFCKEGFEMVYQGKRKSTKKFIYHAPVDENDTSVCLDCVNKSQCCSTSDKGRTIEVPFNVLSHIDPQDPPMSKRFKAIMKRRPSVERMIKRLKCDLSDDRLEKRGNKSFQAYLDKTMIAFHFLLRN